MSERLLESDFITTNLRALFSGKLASTEEQAANEVQTDEKKSQEDAAGNATAPAEEAPQAELEATQAELEALPAKDDWNAWRKLLNDRLDANNKLSATEKKTQYEVESKFFREFFVENWDRSVGAKLLLLGDPLRTAIRVLGFNPAKNPILGFIKQKRVIDDLIFTGKLNVETFKAIYNAVANKLVAHSELINEKSPNDEYNIIYCKDLYNKPVKEMLEYLKLQSQILKVSATQYTADIQLANKRAFLNVGDVVKEKEEKTRATAINKLGHDKMPTVVNATLNPLSIAEIICNKSSTPTTSLDEKGQAKLIAQLATLADKYAALLSLVLTTQNVDAKKAMNDPAFTGLSSDEKLSAAIALSTKGIMPKGQLNKADTDILVAKIIASLPKKAGAVAA